MDLDDYQLAAMSTDQMGPAPTIGDLSAPELQVSILGLAGEIGELLAEIKKSVRDRENQPKFIERIQEELGDILWYLASTADKFGLSWGMSLSIIWGRRIRDSALRIASDKFD